MIKPGISIAIPGFGQRHIQTLVSDYSGTCSCRGKLVRGVRERFRKLARRVDIHIVTADTFGTARTQLKAVPLAHLEILKGENHDIQKREYGQRFDCQHVAAFGNGNNDRLLLKTVKDAGGIAIAVDNGEGCALDAALSAHLLIVNIVNALDLLLDLDRCKATLRF